MFATNLKIIAVVLGTIMAYTLLASSIPQVESDVPEELTLAADFTAEDIAAAGEELYFGAGGCTACHGLGTRAPNLLENEPGLGPIGARCGQRVSGQECKEYLYQSMVEPNVYVVEGFQPIMPDMRRTLSAAQIWAIVAYLQSQGGEVTVAAADIQATEAPETGGPPGVATAQAAPAGPASTTTDPMELLRGNQCLACHQLGDEGGPIGPPLTGIGARRDADYIRSAILDPAAEITAGYEAVGGIMPATFGQQLTAAQLEAMVRYLASQR